PVAAAAVPPAPLTVIYRQLEEELSHWLGPRAAIAHFQLAQVSDLLRQATTPPSPPASEEIGEGASAGGGEAPAPLDAAAWQAQWQSALDQLEDVLEALSLPPR